MLKDHPLNQRPKGKQKNYQERNSMKKLGHSQNQDQPATAHCPRQKNNHPPRNHPKRMKNRNDHLCVMANKTLQRDEYSDSIQFLPRREVRMAFRSSRSCGIIESRSSMLWIIPMGAPRYQYDSSAAREGIGFVEHGRCCGRHKQVHLCD